MKYRFIMENRSSFRLEKMCKMLEVSRSGYHKYVNRKMSNRRVEKFRILAQIKMIYERSRCCYGSRRIQVELRDLGICCNRKRVSRIMRENNIQARQRRRYKVTTNSGHKKPISSNLVNMNFRTEAANKIWASDITYIWTKEGWLYLAVIMDLYSRMIVGWSLGQMITSTLVVKALQQAFINRTPDEGLIFHSDRGSQYASKEIREILKAHKCNQSMSGKGNCYDNAVVESFFHTLKTELVHQNIFSTRDEARRKIFDYIEIFYNRQRRHSSLDYFSPVDFENKHIKLVA